MLRFGGMSYAKEIATSWDALRNALTITKHARTARMSLLRDVIGAEPSLALTAQLGIKSETPETAPFAFALLVLILHSFALLACRLLGCLLLVLCLACPFRSPTTHRERHRWSLQRSHSTLA